MNRKKINLPGDRSKQNTVASMVRVDHAGEYGAVRIYEGQLAVLRKQETVSAIQHMLEQERIHLKKFEFEIVNRRVRPTALLPLWHVLGFALGAGSALLGSKAAMACTVAVEEVIDKHYEEQIDEIENYSDEIELKSTFQDFRDEELEHRDTGLEYGANNFSGHFVLNKLVKIGATAAIWLSKRI